MEVKFKVRRYNPAADGEPTYQLYTIDAPESATILDSLLMIREQIDGSLAFRCACRSAICGSCAMRINGQARLACKTKVVDMAADGGEVLVEPVGNLPVIRDLVVDQDPFWEKVQAIEPWLQPAGPEPKREYLVDHETMVHLSGMMACIMCGACMSDCTVLEVDKSFLGPAPLAKAYRLVGDPRDASDEARLRNLSALTGIWDCTRCLMCVEVCPKLVAPMETILGLRRKAIEAGYTDNLGARHTLEFDDTVRESSWLG